MLEHQAPCMAELKFFCTLTLLHFERAQAQD
jgi:hypothetical protein